MTASTLLQRITDYANRADPYPLYAELRETPVAPQDGGTYLVGTYDEVLSLLHDPRVSSDQSKRDEAHRGGPAATGLPPAFIGTDPPVHDRLRRLATRPFGPPHTPARIDGMRDELGRIAARLIDGFQDPHRIDLVDEFAYPLPVTVICSLLGVPDSEQPRFHGWADAIVSSIDPSPHDDPTERQRAGAQARREMGQYMFGLMQKRRAEPGDDLLSGFVHDGGPEGALSPQELIVTSVLLFVAGHETTVNLITNGMLTLLRYPDVLERLRRDPDLVVPVVEELLRYEPPIQMLPNRTAIADIELAGTTIPRGAPVALALASANRDPRRFRDPDRFDPGRPDNEHAGFGSGVHHCFGAPLARLETQIALTQLVRRLQKPRLVEDPPPYRQNAVLRGPRHLLVQCDEVTA
jgi:cytochrome P450